MFKMLMQRNPYASRGLEKQRLPKATLSEQWAMMGSSTSLVEIFKIDWNFLYYGYVPGLQEQKHPKNKLQFGKKKTFFSR